MVETRSDKVVVDDDTAFQILMQRSIAYQEAKQNQVSEGERIRRLFRSSRSGNLALMIGTLSLYEINKDAEKVFRKRDAEGKLIINNVLLNGHLDMLEYILTHWIDALNNLDLSLEGHTSLLHQAMG